MAAVAAVAATAQSRTCGGGEGGVALVLEQVFVEFRERHFTVYH